MKTQKEMIKLLAESDTIEQTDVMMQSEIYDESGKELGKYILYRCTKDACNLFDFLALAIDQIGKEDGINLIDEILSVLNDGEDTPTEEDHPKIQSGRMTGFQPAQQIPRPKELKLESAPIRNLGKEEREMEEDAQAAELYMNIFQYEEGSSDNSLFVEAKIKLNELGYEANNIHFYEDGEPKLKKDGLASPWKSPNFDWDEWAKNMAEKEPYINHDKKVNEVYNELCTLMVGLKWDDGSPEIEGLQNKYKIDHDDMQYLELEGFTYPIKSIHHLVEQIMEKTKKTLP